MVDAWYVESGLLGYSILDLAFISSYVNRCHQDHFYNSITHIPDKTLLLFLQIPNIYQKSQHRSVKFKAKYMVHNRNFNFFHPIFCTLIVKHFDLLPPVCKCDILKKQKFRIRLQYMQNLHHPRYVLRV